VFEYFSRISASEMVLLRYRSPLDDDTFETIKTVKATARPSDAIAAATRRELARTALATRPSAQLKLPRHRHRHRHRVGGGDPKNRKDGNKESLEEDSVDLW